MKTIILFAVLLALTTLLPACNTMRGVGEDMAAVGNTIARTGR
jgi:predicted small secreted protein